MKITSLIPISAKFSKNEDNKKIKYKIIKTILSLRNELGFRNNIIELKYYFPIIIDKLKNKQLNISSNEIVTIVEEFMNMDKIITFFATPQKILYLTDCHYHKTLSFILVTSLILNYISVIMFFIKSYFVVIS